MNPALSVSIVPLRLGLRHSRGPVLGGNGYGKDTPFGIADAQIPPTGQNAGTMYDIGPVVNVKMRHIDCKSSRFHHWACRTSVFVP